MRQVVASPLLYAIKYGHVAIVNLFLSRKLLSVGEEKVQSH